MSWWRAFGGYLRLLRDIDSLPMSLSTD